LSRKDRIEASQGMQQMLGLSNTLGGDEDFEDQNNSSRSISKVDLSINNYDKSIHDITRSASRAPTWKSKVGVERKRRISTLGVNNEFQEGVFHILDRSHIKYKILISDDFTIESEQAKKRIKVHKQLMNLLGPSKFQDYHSQQLDKVKKNLKSLRTGVFRIKKPEERNILFSKEIVDRANSRRKVSINIILIMNIGSQTGLQLVV
jgi:hypothetical protein